MQYNEAQEKAVAHQDGPMQVLAGPGTGKTAVITARTCRLVKSGTSPGSVLVVTFTRAAAAEMRGRIRQGLGPQAAGITVGTFHGVFYGILRAECNLPANNILSGRERHALLAELVTHAWKGAVTEAELPEQVGREISFLKGSGITPRHYYSPAMPEEVFRAVWEQYESYLAENGRMDFDDIIRNCRALFLRRPDVLRRWQEKFRYILVDEFQDISPMQYEIVRMLALPENNLFIVGDDDQSIYRFRGANPEMMLGFRKQYPGSEQVALKINYRCSSEILEKSGQLISANRHRFAKQLRSARGPVKPVGFRVFQSPAEEAAWIVREIRQLVKEGIPPEETAVLFRTNAGCRPVIEQLITEQVPFYAVDQIPCIFDHWIAKDLLAYMELAAGSRRRSDFLQVCNRPNRYLSRRAFQDAVVPFEVLYDYYEDKDWMGDRIFRLEQDLRAIAALPPYGAVQYIQTAVGYGEWLKAHAEERGLQPQELLDVLEELKESARRARDLSAWKLQMEQMRERLRREQTGSGVAIATLHAAKGREFQSVFIADVNEGIIPWHKALLDADLEEERRMLYVGMTRARDLLQLCAVRKRYGKTMEVSHFLAGMFV
ncbi:MAG: ATP-dependent helicase [Eubacterium sp.]|nr:ATP-dependent helicase [Eubacterium sp.]